MELILTEEQRLLSDSAGTFFARLGGIKRARELRNREPGFDRDALRQMAGNGWLGLLVPEDRGGAQLGPVELALLLQQAGRALAPEPIAEAALAALMIAQASDWAIAERFLPGALAGATVVLPALLEPTGGLEPDDLGATALPGPGGHRLSGQKSFVPSAGGCDGFLVSARAADGPIVAHVARAAAGLDLRLVATVEGRSYGELTLREAVADGVLAAGEAAAAMLRRHHGLALLAAAAEMLGVIEAVSERTLDYLKTRKQFGRPIGGFQALQHRSVDNYVLIESLRSLLYQICAAGEPVPVAMASALKALASSAGLTVAKSAVQLHGAIGFTDEYDIGLYLKRAMWLSSYLGNESHHRARFASLADLT